MNVENNKPAGRGFSDRERRAIAALADLVIPADEVRGRPSASSVDIVAHLDASAEVELKDLISKLEDRAKQTLQSGFVELGVTERTELVQELRQDSALNFRGFAIWVTTAYYQDPRVLLAIGLESRAPYPLGFSDRVVEGDLSLLDPVKTKGRRYREA